MMLPRCSVIITLSLSLITSVIAVSSDTNLLESTCDGGDTEWNRNVVGSYLRYWIRSIQMSTKMSPANYAVWFRHNVQNAKDGNEGEARLHFIVKTDELTGKPKGPAWQNYGYRGPRFHDGHIYGKVGNNHQFTGDNIAFIYPDFETALIGEFVNGVMISAKPTKIVAERCKDGIKELKFAKPKKNAPIFKYERPSRDKIGDQPIVADPFERKRVFIDKGVYQDGIFARHDIRMGELVCYYAGVIFDPKVDPIFFYNQTQSEKYSVHRNLIGLGEEGGRNLQLNVPEQFWNTTRFRSTLGHKINHSFIKTKTEFDHATHPRFGWIRSLVAIEDIYKDEEIFINYHYAVRADIRVPSWYKALYEVEVGPWPKPQKGQIEARTF